MDFRIWSQDGTGLAIGAALSREGAEVDHVPGTYDPKLYSGIIPYATPQNIKADGRINIFTQGSGVATFPGISSPVGIGELNRQMGDAQFSTAVCESFGVAHNPPDAADLEIVNVQAYYHEGNQVAGTIFQWIQADRLMEANRGPVVPAAMVIGQFSKRKCPPLFHRTIRKIEPLLRQFRFSGPITATVGITDDNQTYCLGFSSNVWTWGSPCQLEALTGSLGRFFSEGASGSDMTEIVDHRWTGSLTLSIPPHPYTGLDLSTWLGVDPPVHIPLQDGYHPGQVYMKDQEVRSCGPMIGYVTARGKGLAQVKARLQILAREVQGPFLQYRTDVVREFGGRVSRLRNEHFI
jgi:hypothetical protein